MIREYIIRYNDETIEEAIHFANYGSSEQKFIYPTLEKVEQIAKSTFFECRGSRIRVYQIFKKALPKLVQDWQLVDMAKRK